MEANSNLFVIVSDLEFKMGTPREVISLSSQCVEVFFFLEVGLKLSMVPSTDGLI